ncbi:MAG: VWA domain-containing protein [Chromatiaceae bacterium]|mgnify:FL=1|nr:VWA domain-containing protein [Chromatiaceae bacterium]
MLNTAAAPQRARLDLVFLIDATGSMGDEIGKLKTTLRAIAGEVAQLPSRPDTCFGLVAYRDRGDAFLVRRHDFTNDLGSFQSVLDALQANGGGDYPEAMNEALHETVHRMSWRGTGATRMVVLLADAPPHLDYGGPQYDDDMMAALGKGIKVFSVGASGLDKQGEYVQRQIAQYTGGRFVFLTYRDANRPASGPGRETVHDVSNYSVQTLDRLIVRLVSEELGKLPKAD